LVSGRISLFHFPLKRIYTKFRIPPIEKSVVIFYDEEE